MAKKVYVRTCNICRTVGCGGREFHNLIFHKENDKFKKTISLNNKEFLIEQEKKEE